MALRVCLIGAVSLRPAEGMENVLRSLSTTLARHAEVTTVDARALIRGRGWKQIRRFQPDVVHYVAGPSPLSFVTLWAVRCMVPSASSVISSIHPMGLGSGRIVRQVKPDLVLTQAADTEEQFTHWQIPTCFVPNGVDTRRFRPVGPQCRERLRHTYGLDHGRPVLLHVGHIKPGRNLEALIPLARAGYHVLVVGSSSTVPDTATMDRLAAAGIDLRREYMPRIEELYQAADLYVFPTIDRQHCIETPLSVLEAAAVGLPVLATTFGALPRLFGSAPAIRLMADPTDFGNAVPELLRAGRGSAQVPDWSDVAGHIHAIYIAVRRDDRTPCRPYGYEEPLGQAVPAESILSEGER